MFDDEDAEEEGVFDDMLEMTFNVNPLVNTLQKGMEKVERKWARALGLISEDVDGLRVGLDGLRREDREGREGLGERMGKLEAMRDEERDRMDKELKSLRGDVRQLRAVVLGEEGVEGGGGGESGSAGGLLGRMAAAEQRAEKQEALVKSLAREVAEGLEREKRLEAQFEEERHKSITELAETELKLRNESRKMMDAVEHRVSQAEAIMRELAKEVRKKMDEFESLYMTAEEVNALIEPSRTAGLASLKRVEAMMVEFDRLAAELKGQGRRVETLEVLLGRLNHLHDELTVGLSEIKSWHQGVDTHLQDLDVAYEEMRKMPTQVIVQAPTRISNEEVPALVTMDDVHRIAQNKTFEETRRLEAFMKANLEAVRVKAERGGDRAEKAAGVVEGVWGELVALKKRMELVDVRAEEIAGGVLVEVSEKIAQMTTRDETKRLQKDITTQLLTLMNLVSDPSSAVARGIAHKAQEAGGGDEGGAAAESARTGVWKGATGLKRPGEAEGMESGEGQPRAMGGDAKERLELPPLLERLASEPSGTSERVPDAEENSERIQEIAASLVVQRDELVRQVSATLGMENKLKDLIAIQEDAKKHRVSMEESAALQLMDMKRYLNEALDDVKNRVIDLDVQLGQLTKQRKADSLNPERQRVLASGPERRNLEPGARRPHLGEAATASGTATTSGGHIPARMGPVDTLAKQLQAERRRVAELEETVSRMAMKEELGGVQTALKTLADALHGEEDAFRKRGANGVNLLAASIERALSLEGGGEPERPGPRPASSSASGIVRPVSARPRVNSVQFTGTQGGLLGESPRGTREAVTPRQRPSSASGYIGVAMAPTQRNPPGNFLKSKRDLAAEAMRR